MRLIIVRHGETQSNVDKLLDTAIPGAELNELGHSQAEALVQTLGAEPIDAIYASTLTRAQQTAAPLAKHLGLAVQIRDGIREIAAGEAEMAGDVDSLTAYVATLTRWATGALDAKMPGGESGLEFFARFNEVIDEIEALGIEVAVLVSHGAAIRCWSAHAATNVDSGFVAARPIANTAAVVLTGNQTDGWQIQSWAGDTEFREANAASSAQ